MAKGRSSRGRSTATGRRVVRDGRPSASAPDRGQRVVLVFGILVLVAFGVGMVLAFRNAGEDDTASSTSTSSTSVPDPAAGPTPTAAGPPVSVPSVPPGEQLSTLTECPPEDGSAPRVTSFAGPPPICIEEHRTYNATITTSVGDLEFFLSPEQGLETVNNFVVLARYHYYDGMPLTRIDPAVDFQVAPAIENPAGVSSPGYEVPLDANVTIVSPGTIALLGSGEPGREAGGFKVALGTDAVGWSEDSAIIGLLRDGLETLQAIRKAGTPGTGAPTSVITIESITIEPGIETTTTTGG